MDRHHKMSAAAFRDRATIETQQGTDFFVVVCPICGESETLIEGARKMPDHHGYGPGRCGSLTSRIC